MTEKLLSLACTVGVTFLFYLFFRRWKGIRLRYGFAGIVLIIMPYFLAVFQNQGDRIYNIPVLIGALIGVFLLMWDIPQAGKRNPD